MSADAGQVNVVAWETGADGVNVWLRDHPTLRAKGSSLHEAADALYEQLLQRGDGEAILEFDPMPQVDMASRHVVAHYAGLAYNESIEIANDRRALFSGGVCEVCGRGLGHRTAEPLELVRKPRSDVFRAARRWPDDIYPYRSCVSERFVGLLTESERAGLKLRPVVCANGASGYFEICGDSIATAHGLTGATYATKLDQSWRCSACGQAVFMLKDTVFPANAVLLPASTVGAGFRRFLVFDEDGAAGPRPAFTPSRWRILIEKKNRLRGLCSSPVYVLPDADLDPRPTLPDHWSTRSRDRAGR